MLKDDIAVIEDFVCETEEFRIGYGPAWERIKKVLESPNSIDNNERDVICCICKETKHCYKSTAGRLFCDNCISKLAPVS